MKILTVCSSPDVSLEPITTLLEHAGLSKGLNSEENNQSYEQWHEQVFDAYEQDCSGLFIKQALSPGKVWQDMAGQLIYANLTQRQWYWSASKAGWLLDFWHELEPQHRFALIYTSPQVGIIQCLLKTSEQNSAIETVIQSWVNYHFEILRFYRSHKDKCILVNYDQCLTHPVEFIQTCKQDLSLEFNEKDSFQLDSSVNQMQSIEEVLYSLIAKQYPEIDLLFQELKASATPLGQQDKSQSVVQIDAKEQLGIVWQDYRNLITQQADGIEVNIHLQQELEELKKVYEKEKTQEKETFQNKIGQYKQQNKEQETENELILLQLHQVQEELEVQFQEAQKLKTERAEEERTLQESIKKLEEAKSSLEKQKSQETQVLQNKVNKLEETLITLEKQKTEEKETFQNEIGQCKQQNKEQETENELMLLQLHQVQEELEHYFMKYQELEQQSQASGIIAFIEQAELDSPIQALLIQVKQEADDLEVELINLQWQEQVWPSYHLRIIKSRVIHDQPTLAAIKLPLQSNNFLPLKTWPPQTADETGAYWAINTDLLIAEMTHSSFYPEDIAFLHALLQKLPQWLTTLEKTMRLKNNDWSDYYLAIEDVKPALDCVYQLQK